MHAQLHGGVMRRLFSFKVLILVLLAAGIGALVALVVNQKQKFAGMSDEDIRAYLDQKLGGRMSEDQVRQIQDAVLSAVKGASATADAASDVAETAKDAASDVAEAAKDAASDVADAAGEATDES